MPLSPESTSESTPNQVWIFILAAIILNPTGLANIAGSVVRTPVSPEVCVTEEVPTP